MKHARSSLKNRLLAAETLGAFLAQFDLTQFLIEETCQTLGPPHTQFSPVEISKIDQYVFQYCRETHETGIRMLNFIRPNRFQPNQVNPVNLTFYHRFFQFQLSLVGWNWEQGCIEVTFFTTPLDWLRRPMNTKCAYQTMSLADFKNHVRKVKYNRGRFFVPA